MTRIFLVGYMGAGKTKLGQAIAKELRLSFVDLDQYIEERRFKPIAAIFSELGEEGFRKIEQSCLYEAAQFENVLIATGGGTACFEDNIDYMNSQGDTVYIQLSAEDLFKRLNRKKQNRPLLSKVNNEDLQTRIAEMLNHRESFYKQAKYILPTGGLNKEESLILFREIYSQSPDSTVQT